MSMQLSCTIGLLLVVTLHPLSPRGEDFDDLEVEVVRPRRRVTRFQGPGIKPNKFDVNTPALACFTGWTLPSGVDTIASYFASIAGGRQHPTQASRVVAVAVVALVVTSAVWYLMYNHQYAGVEGGGEVVGGDEIGGSEGVPAFKWSGGGLTLSAEAGYTTITLAERALSHLWPFLSAAGLLALQWCAQGYIYAEIERVCGKDAAEEHTQGKKTIAELTTAKMLKTKQPSVSQIIQAFGNINLSVGIQDVLGDLPQLLGLAGHTHTNAGKAGKPTTADVGRVGLVAWGLEAIVGKPSYVSGIRLAAALWMLLPMRLAFTAEIGSNSWTFNGLPHIYDLHSTWTYMSGLYYAYQGLSEIYNDPNTGSTASRVWALATGMK